MAASSSASSKRGRFITLEGGEAVGKSTLARALKAALESRGESVLLTREPGGAPGAEFLRSILLSPPAGVDWAPLAEAMLFSAARVEHLEKTIRPALESGAWVLCDRFADSTRAYQTALHPDLRERVLELEAITVGRTRPELTLVLDLSYDAAMERLKHRGAAPDAIESRGRDFHDNVRKAFLEIAAREPHRCVVLDASRDVASLAREALAVIDLKWSPP